jgi:hypothetical protein
VTQVLITIDTELSPLLYQQGADADVNFSASIDGRTDSGVFGIGWQMDRLEASGLKGVFFIDPMPALVYGPGVIARIVGPIRDRGHDVQLHIHTEWLTWALDPPVTARGSNIGDFSLADQIALIGYARDALMAAGAACPLAFRAGNYGADDDTLRALATLGIKWDSSFNVPYIGAPCAIGLSKDVIEPLRHLSVNELPVAGIHDAPGHVRHAQICALSAREMKDALDHAVLIGQSAFAIVTHSFEMLSRDRKRANPVVMRRFDALCRHIARDARLISAVFADLPAPRHDSEGVGERLPPNLGRTTARVAEQAMATLLYERR